MFFDLELVLLTDGTDDPLQREVLEFDDLVALLAVQMVMLRIAVVVLVMSALTDVDGAKQASINQFAQSPVDGGPANLNAFTFHFVDELFGVKMIVVPEDEAYHLALLSGEALRPWPAGQVLAELFFRTLRYFHRGQRHRTLLFDRY
jgi:hypothetical protein